MQVQGNIQPYEQLLAWRPKIWWDPVPDWFRDHLTVEIATSLARVQLEKHHGILEIEQRAVKQTMEILGKLG
ncbi:MAG: hypothetical protein ABFS14_04660 [Gemmatimonadota bacterium]